MPLKRTPERVLIVSLSNVGDAFLTAPVVHAVRNAFPKAALSVLVGAQAEAVFRGDPRLEEVIVYDKRASLREKWGFIRELRKKRFDGVIDLRHSLFPILVGASWRTPLLSKPPRDLLHRMDRHLWQAERLGLAVNHPKKEILWIQPEAESAMKKELQSQGLRLTDPFILFSPGSKSTLKRWNSSGFARLADRLYETKRLPPLFVGEAFDAPFVESIIQKMKSPSFSLAGRTSVPEAVVLVQKARLLVTNDNAALHMASLLDTPTVAIFGPTDPKKYGPRSARSRVVRKDLFCSPCEKAECPYHHECMEELPVEEVYQACSELL